MDKAQTARERNKAAREAQRAKRAAEEQQDKALVLEALRAVLKDPDATTDQRLYAVVVLDNMERYSFVPYGIKYQGSADTTAFVDALKKQEEKHG